MSAGRLVLVATPIGNLGDLSPRAAEALITCDVVVCEDTRRTGLLLQRIGATSKRLIVANEHTEAHAATAVAQLLAGGSVVAVVTDAGTPGIADPGERLVLAALEVGAIISIVPGPVAATAALVISGLPAARHVHEGFLPRSGRERQLRVAEAVCEQRTVVMYEAPHRLHRLLDELSEAGAGSRAVVLVRELTKLHEEVWRGCVDEARLHVTDIAPRGEYVVILAAAPVAPVDLDSELASALATGVRPRDAASDVAKRLGVSRNLAYSRALELSQVGRTQRETPLVGHT